MTMVAPLGEIGAFRFWCQKILPAVYDDSLSYYELLCKVIDKLNEVIEQSNDQSTVINILAQNLQNLADEFETFKESGFEDYYEEQLTIWLDHHMNEIMRRILQNGVYFELTLDGYFAANIFYSWASVWFDTISDYNDENYGSLVLIY